MGNKYSKYCQGPETKLNIWHLDEQEPKMVYNQQRLEPVWLLIPQICFYALIFLFHFHSRLHRFVYIIISVI